MAVGKSDFKNMLSEASVNYKKYGSADPFYALQKLLVSNDGQLIKALTDAGESSYEATKDIYEKIGKQYKEIWNS